MADDSPYGEISVEDVIEYLQDHDSDFTFLVERHLDADGVTEHHVAQLPMGFIQREVKRREKDAYNQS